MDSNRILIVDDDATSRVLAETVLLTAGYDVRVADGGPRALEIAAEWTPSIIMLDVMMPVMDGFETLENLRRIDDLRNTAVVFMTATDDKALIVKALEAGATGYISKPLRRHELVARLSFQRRQQKRQTALEEEARVNASLRDHMLDGELQHPEMFANIITDDGTMYALFQYMEAISATSRPVLVTGETGVGKEETARTIHRLSGRSGEFVSVNVAGLDDTMFSDTLFGHTDGAFTGAVGSRPGLIESAESGTLFLDEIGDLPAMSQIKLLRLLQEGEYYALGSDKRSFCGARIVVATNRGVDDLRSADDFRTDLYYRLSAHHVGLPPLRERRGDISLLLDYFVSTSAANLNRQPPSVPNGLAQALQDYDFPGNIRELEALVFDAVSRSRDGILSLLPFLQVVDSIDESAPPLRTPLGSHDDLLTCEPFPDLKGTTQLLIEAAMERSGGNQTQAADLLGISRQALNKRLVRSRKA